MHDIILCKMNPFKMDGYQMDTCKMDRYKMDIRRDSPCGLESSHGGCRTSPERSLKVPNETSQTEHLVDFRCKQSGNPPYNHVYGKAKDTREEAGGMAYLEHDDECQITAMTDNPINLTSHSNAMIVSKGSMSEVTCSAEEHLDELVIRFRRCLKDNSFEAISVKQLRHVIPLLIMATFDCRAEPMLKKVKGMWTAPPDGWPSHVPFCDPNNGQKVQGKPRKEVLMKMFIYLVNMYAEMHDLSSITHAIDARQIKVPRGVQFHVGKSSELFRRESTPPAVIVPSGNDDKMVSIHSPQSSSMTATQRTIPKLIPMSIALEQYHRLSNDTSVTHQSGSVTSSMTSHVTSSASPLSECNRRLVSNPQSCAVGICDHQAIPRKRVYRDEESSLVSDNFMKSYMAIGENATKSNMASFETPQIDAQISPTLHSLLTSYSEGVHSVKRPRTESMSYNYREMELKCSYLASHGSHRRTCYEEDNVFDDSISPQIPSNLEVKTHDLAEDRDMAYYPSKTIHRSKSEISFREHLGRAGHVSQSSKHLGSRTYDEGTKRSIGKYGLSCDSAKPRTGRCDTPGCQERKVYDTPGSQERKVYDTPGSQERKLYDTPGCQERKLYDTPGCQERKVYDTPGSQERKVYDTPGCQERKVYDTPGCQERKVYDTPGCQERKRYDTPGCQERGELCKSISEEVQLDLSNVLHHTISSKLLQVFKQVQPTKTSTAKVYVTKKSRIFDKMSLNNNNNNVEMDSKDVVRHRRDSNSEQALHEPAMATPIKESPVEVDMEQDGVTHRLSPTTPGAGEEKYTSFESTMEKNDSRQTESQTITSKDECVHYTPCINRKRTHSCSSALSRLPNCVRMCHNATEPTPEEVRGQLINRIAEKVCNLERQQSLTSSHLSLMKSVFDVIRRTDLNDCTVEWLNTVHAYENTLDAILMFQRVSERSMIQWKHFRVACLLHGTKNVEMKYQLSITEST